MLQEFLRYIRAEHLVLPGQKILLTVSGGVDSVVLEHLFCQTDFPYAIAHCNFGLRAEESDDDEAFVQALAQKHKAPFFSKLFDTKAYAEDKGISIQMAARALRNAWFEELLKKHGYASFATAHHLNDSIETFIFNFTKGTGIAGLQGILPRSGQAIRPLLFATRKSIEAYARQHDLQWREDRSNASTVYHRNRLRHQVVPILREINPNLEQTFDDTTFRTRETARILSEYTRQAEKDLVKYKNSGIWMAIDDLMRRPSPTLVLYEIIKNYHFNFRQSREIIQRADGTPGKLFYSATHVLNIDRDFLLIKEATKANEKEYSIPTGNSYLDAGSLHLELKNIALEDFFYPNNSSVALLDQSKLKFPLQVRKWRHGDRFIPLGMSGKKKLSDFMIDEKIPLNLKEHVYVLISDSSIAWVINYRIDDRFKVDHDTRSILLLKAERHG